MRTLDNITITQLLNLKSSSLISDSIAQRQIEVIRKGFNFLQQPENNVLYIGDEVGLGKTYIALGIASLLRHFTENPESYQDVIIVPKENLQNKWEKEIKQFISKNYLLTDNRVKSIIGKPVGNIHIYQKLSSINNDHPSYHLFRNSQFSLGFSKSNHKQVFDSMMEQLNNSCAIEIMNEAYDLGYFTIRKRSALKKLFAYLLSISNPEIELLIVDEGHNFKYGLGDIDDDEVSSRNNVISRFFGLNRKHEDDRELFETFKNLKNLITPKAKKLIVLSATPKTYNLLELRNQLDCFVDQHILKGLKNDEEIKEKLPHLIIRGNMEYQVGDKLFTRNLCRQEHRRGNVEKLLDAPELSIENDEQALILGLLQYSTIKHLDAKNNASFEIGMLAGFETFAVDQKRIYNSNQDDDKEYYNTKSSKIRESQDFDIVKTIVDSYKKKFGDTPPHPKQDAIVNATAKLMFKGEKSLIFVRRVASAKELEEKLLRSWEEIVYRDLSGKWIKKLPSKELNNLIGSYEEYRDNKELTENLDSILQSICTKLCDKNKFDHSFLTDPSKDLKSQLIIGLYYLHSNHKTLNKGQDFYKMLCHQCSLKFIKADLVDLSYEMLQETAVVWLNMETLDDEDEEKETYYFHAFFRNTLNKSFKKNRLYKNDWFDLNYYIFNDTFKISHFKSEKLTKEEISANDPTNFIELQEIFIKNIIDEPYRGSVYNIEDYPSLLVENNTLITKLLTETFHKEVVELIQSLAGRPAKLIFEEVSILVAIITSCLRNGSGFLPLYISDKAEGEFISNYLELIETDGVFNLVMQEIKTIIKDYHLIRSVNFPEGDNIKSFESKLLYQSPVVGLSGSKGRSKTNVATQFRMPGFPYILVTTDIFREGEDLHTYCDNIYHYGIAWNCSDMEQRTGRIDRINSFSHRKLNNSNELLFENRVHVFYPYLKNTLEVNQVNRLFSSINSFVKSFNDFTINLEDEGAVQIGDAIEHMEPVINQHLKSKFEHNYFQGSKENGVKMYPNDCIGTQPIELKGVLQLLMQSLAETFKYKFPVTLELSNFTIFGDIHLKTDRRGPFKLLVVNDITPGKFKIEAHAYLFKGSHRNKRQLKNYLETEQVEFSDGSIDHFSSLTFCQEIESLEVLSFMEKLYNMTQRADEIEKKLTNEDAEVFG